MSEHDLPILYSFRRCPYAMRARLAIYARNFPCELREVELKNKPAHMVQISPKATVPVLQLTNGTVIEESLDIMGWALQQETVSPLLPSVQQPDFEIFELIKRIDGPFKYHLDRYKYSNRYDGAVAEEHREANLPILEELDYKLNNSAHLFSEEIGFGDLAIAPFIRQFAHTDKSWFDQLPYNALQNWLESFLISDYFKNIMKKNAPWDEANETKLIFPSPLQAPSTITS